ncbi:hypothetical protein GUITHDRAFT_164604 [Guillardia theta CCMP2712]|uniref:UBX domain-containing protein n=1 Tax=Guillardia theta (strain CCMP2712) TaxID=905079 RepID=L1IWT2_GUITC|nr:hypothetical protein GUITHDRAFT_164604 [Guillardia theta CCMP2712]EKX40733.1 hypothetical protein GUITHDRAFT_164604 [Guillardia theta CCMP2712]|eukprot:XP_005827713.1 hypothetical protein GUITHDRAFT_164604 [Guillardia theta CCMP2712]
MPPKFGSLDALRGKDEEEDDEEAEAFAGGIGRGGGGSGQNVLDPRKIMDRARDIGAVAASEHESGRSRAFVGSGFSLSGESNQPVVVNEDETKIKHTITFWKEGFTVDDGPLRNFDAPENASFLNDINKGRLPQEFAGEKGAYVSLISRHGESHKESAPAAASAARSFTGQGHSLGGASSSAQAAAANATVQPPSVSINVNDAQPSTTLQLRLHDGTRLTQRFNLSHTVENVYEFVASATPGLEFDLMVSFPVKSLRIEARQNCRMQLSSKLYVEASINLP